MEKLNKYKCTKCRCIFKIPHEVDMDGALCNDCFSLLVKIDNASDYYKFIKKNK